jgi:glycine/serine hydroxymethyltransferase
MDTIAEFIDAVISDPDKESNLEKVRGKVNDMMQDKPLFVG